MQNRRLFKDDDRGVAEPLNERIDGKGVITKSNYRLQLFNFEKEESRQRQEQIEMDSPLFILYAKANNKKVEPQGRF